MKTCKGNGGKVTRILNFNTQEWWVVSLTLRLHYPQNELDWKPDVYQNRCGRSVPLLETETWFSGP